MTAAGASSRDVIVALATAPGNGPMAVVRASGDGAVEALRRVDARMPEGPMRRCVRAAELRLSAGPLPCLAAEYFRRTRIDELHPACEAAGFESLKCAARVRVALRGADDGDRARVEKLRQELRVHVSRGNSRPAT